VRDDVRFAGNPDDVEIVGELLHVGVLREDARDVCDWADCEARGADNAGFEKLSSFHAVP
jgi:hypothetical protein